MKILLIGGFLGSGKTSILLQLAKYLIAKERKPDGISVMIIENEIGDVGVDDKLLKSQGLEVKDLFAGCACCTSGGELLSDINKIKNEIDPNWIIIEATGVAYPRQIKESVETYFQVPVKILALADASRWKRLKNAMSGLLEAQMDVADCILINKVDLVDEETADKVAEDIRAFNGSADIRKVTGIRPIGEDVWQSIV
jgi:G3E family GTPase